MMKLFTKKRKVKEVFGLCAGWEKPTDNIKKETKKGWSEKMKKKRVSRWSKEDDREFSRRIREAWKSYDRGEFKSMKAEDFLKEIEKW